MVICCDMVRIIKYSYENNENNENTVFEYDTS